MWLELSEELPSEAFVLQDSYDGRYWRDLAPFDDEGVYKEGRRWFIERRFYRAVEKDLDQPMEALAKARERWKASALTDYQYVYWNSGSIGLVEELVVVRDGKTTESYVVQEPFPDFGTQTRTVDDVFAAIESAWDGGAAAIQVRYHPTLGFPESTYIDYDTRIADEEWSHEIVIPPGTAQEALKRSKRLWRRVDAGDYQYQLKFQSNLAQWEGRVEVTNGVAAFVSTDSKRPPEAVALVIADYHSMVENAIAADQDVHFAYHPDSGMPTFISIDWTATFVDGPGHQLWISDFTKL